VLECLASVFADDYSCSGYGARTIVESEVGVEYFIFVPVHVERLEGDFVLTVSPIDLAPNDECTDALAVVPDSRIIYGDTERAIFDNFNSDCDGYLLQLHRL